MRDGGGGRRNADHVFIFAFRSLMEKARLAGEASRGKETEVYVMSVGGDGLVKERMLICKQLWDAGIKASRLLSIASSFSFR